LNPHTLAGKWSRAEEKLEHSRKHRKEERRREREGDEREPEARVDAVHGGDGYETDPERFGELIWTGGRRGGADFGAPSL
jgi:hypothetical protein